MRKECIFFFRQQEIPNWQILIEMVCICVLFWAFQIYGIDAASGAAVSALNISAGDHVLDLCAAPGKLVSAS